MSGSLLDWEIESNPDWGDWTFNPDNGINLKPEDGSVTVNVEVIAPNDINEEFTGIVKVINSDDPNDFCEIDVVLTTPRSRLLQNSLILRLLEQFPNAFPLLRLLLGL